jgi:hypothetical protein
MRNKLSMLAGAVIVIGLLTGCVTNQTPLTPAQKTEQRIQRAKRIAEAAAFDSALLEMKDKNNTPQNRAMFAGITNQLAGFLGATNISPTDVAAYISTLPIKQLKTMEGQMIAGGVLMIIDEVLGDTYAVDVSKLTPVIESAIKGFGRAIQFAEANPYVPPAPKPAKTNVTSIIMPPIPVNRGPARTAFVQVVPVITVHWSAAPRVFVQSSVDLVTWTDVGRVDGDNFIATGDGTQFYRAFASPTLEWSSQPEQQVTGYKVYTGEASGSYLTVVDVGPVNAYSFRLLPKTHYCAVTAYDEYGLESEFSEEVTYIAPRIDLVITKS